MKNTLFVLILTLLSKGLAQTKLCEENSKMYSICYYLDSNGMFNCSSYFCSSEAYGAGTYKKTKKTLTFTFDSLIYPKIDKQFVAIDSGKVKISVHHLSSGLPIEYINVFYNNRIFRTNSSGKVEFKYTGGPIGIYSFLELDSVIINPEKDNFNNYEIFWSARKCTAIEKGTIITMTKKGNRYKYKHKVRAYDNKKNIYYEKWITSKYLIRKVKKT